MNIMIPNHQEWCNIDFIEDISLREKRYSLEAWKKLHIFMQIYPEDITTQFKDTAYKYVYWKEQQDILQEMRTAEDDYTTQMLLLRNLEQLNKDFVILFQDYLKYQQEEKNKAFYHKITIIFFHITDKISSLLKL